MSKLFERLAVVANLLEGRSGGSHGVNAENYFDAAQALYWYASDYHSGQSSEIYSILSQLEYKPGASERGPDTEEAKAFYRALELGKLKPDVLLKAIELAHGRSEAIGESANDVEEKHEMREAGLLAKLDEMIGLMGEAAAPGKATYTVYRYQYREMKQPKWDAKKGTLDQVRDSLPPTVMAKPGLWQIVAKSPREAMQIAHEKWKASSATECADEVKLTEDDVIGVKTPHALPGRLRAAAKKFVQDAKDLRAAVQQGTLPDQADADDAGEIWDVAAQALEKAADQIERAIQQRLG